MTLANSKMMVSSQSAYARGKLTIKLDVFADNGALSLIVLVDGYLDLSTVDVPSAHASDKVVKLASREIQPRLEDAPVDLTHSLADGSSNTYTHQFLEA